MLKTEWSYEGRVYTSVHRPAEREKEEREREREIERENERERE